VAQKIREEYFFVHILWGRNNYLSILNFILQILELIKFYIMKCPTLNFKVMKKSVHKLFISIWNTILVA